MRTFVLGAIFLLCAGCTQAPEIDLTPTRRAANFGPSSMRIHPVFTQMRDWTGDGKADGIEALVEFQDEFGDPTKAAGKILFELFDFRRGAPDPRGRRVVNPWVASLLTMEDQREHWNRTSRTYGFKLALTQIDPSRTYVLSATFEREGGGRFFDKIVIEAPPDLRNPSTQAHEQPRPRVDKR